MHGGEFQGYYYAAAGPIPEGTVVMTSEPIVSAPLLLTKSTLTSISGMERAMLPHLLRLSQSSGMEVGVLLLLVRCFTMQVEDKFAFDGILSLEAHLDRQPKELLNQWKAVAQGLGDIGAQVAQASWNTTFDGPTCVQLLAIIAINSFGTYGDDMRGQPTGLGVSTDGARFQHSCDPNVFVDHNAAALVFRALHDIAPGEPLVISYVDAFHPRWRRQRALWSSKLFW